MATTPAPPSHRRIGHKKSRLGCVRCKARHVKCDEQAPCRNCVRHGLECSLVPGSPASSAQNHQSPRSLPTPISRGHDHPSSSTPSHHHPSPASQSQPQQPHQPQQQQQQLDHHGYSQKPHSGPSRSSTLAGGNGYPDVLCSEPPGIYTPHWMQSVRLFHHFCQHTAYHMSSNPPTTDLWRKRVPDVACSHEFLMHGLLACSALHYARTHPAQGQEFTLVSTHYQTLALQFFSNRLSDMNEDNVEAYFLLATFIFVLAIATISDPLARQNKSAEPKDLAQSFVLLQGVKGILDAKAAEKLGQHDGPLAAMLHGTDDLRRPRPSHVSSFTRRLDRLLGLARELESSMFLDIVNNPQTACILALESLRHTYYGCIDANNSASPMAAAGAAATSSLGSGMPGPLEDPRSPADSASNRAAYRSMQDAEQGQRYTWLWPLTLTQVFMQLVDSGNYMALIIVAHYAAMARPYEGPSWVTKGWAQSVLAIVENHLHPDKHKWIAWPKRSILEEIHVDDMPEET